jgi:hypothetical protein
MTKPIKISLPEAFTELFESTCQALQIKIDCFGAGCGSAEYVIADPSDWDRIQSAMKNEMNAVLHNCVIDDNEN